MECTSRQYSSCLYYSGSSFLTDDGHCFALCKGQGIDEWISDLMNYLKNSLCSCDQWTDLTLGQAYTPATIGQETLTPQYRLFTKACDVQLHGVVAGEEDGGFQEITILPPGFRPPVTRYFICWARVFGESTTDTFANVYVDANGYVVPTNVQGLGQGEDFLISLDQIYFNLNN